MSKKRRLEWSFFLNDRSRVTYNELCRRCRRDCKQSFRAVVIECPKYLSKRSRKGAEKKREIGAEPETAENQLELIPAGRWGHPYEMGALPAFLCSSGAGFIDGVDILADGGQNAGIFAPQI